MPETERMILVVGVGRSGTSLTMQALERLGAGLSQDLIPASETNRRGAFEDREVRDRMTVLGHRFGHFNGRPLPADWQADNLARETRSWLETHLARLAARCSSTTLAVKFPLSSIFLPIWYEAADAAGLELRLVWATRRAEDVIGSLHRAFGSSADDAGTRFLLRMHSLLKDLSPGALLLPYEGWRKAPEEQIRALAEAAGLPAADHAAILSDLFDPELDHGGGAALPASEDTLLRRIDETVSFRRGRAADLFGPDLAPLRQLAEDVVQALPAREPEPEETGQLRAQLSRRTNQLRRVEEKTSRHEAEIARLKTRLEDSRQKAAEAARTLAELRTAHQTLTRLRDADEQRRKNLIADHKLAIQHEQNKAENRMATERQKSTRSGARAEKAESDNAALRDNLAQTADRAETAERQCDAYRAELEALYGSVRWRMGDMISQSYHRPRPRDLLLPARLVGLWRGRKRRH